MKAKSTKTLKMLKHQILATFVIVALVKLYVQKENAFLLQGMNFVFHCQFLKESVAQNSMNVMP